MTQHPLQLRITKDISYVYLNGRKRKAYGLPLVLRVR